MKKSKIPRYVHETVSEKERKAHEIGFHSLRHSHGTLLAYHRATEKYILYRLGDIDPRMAKRYTRVLNHLEDPLAAEATEKITKNINFDTTFDTKSKKQVEVMNKKQETKEITAHMNIVKMSGHSDYTSGAGKRT